jgi:hypothetical protein
VPAPAHVVFVVVVGQYEPTGQRFCAIELAGQYTPAPEHVYFSAGVGQYEPAGQFV